MSCITLISKLMGFLRDLLIASRFGASAISDAFISANMVPNIVDAIVAASILTVVIPLVTSAKAKGKDKLAGVLMTVSLVTVVLYGVETVLLAVFAPAVMRSMVSGFDAASMAKAISLVRILSPTVALMGLASFLSGVANVYGSFTFPSVTVLASNAAMLVAAGIYWNRITIDQLAWATVVGYVVQVLMLIVCLRRLQVRFLGTEVNVSDLSASAGLVVPMVAANLLGQLTPLAEKYFASHMAAGSIAALNYALKLVQLPQGVIVSGVAAILFAKFSELAVQREHVAMSRELGTALRGLLSIILPIAGMSVALATPVVATAFRRGQFNDHAVAITAIALRAYAVGLVPLAVWPVVTRVLHALNDTKTHLVATAVGAVAYFLSALVLDPMFGHVGLACAFVVGQFASMLVVSFVIQTRLGSAAFRMVATALPVSVGATIVGSAAAWLMSLQVGRPWAQVGGGAVVGGGVYAVTHVLCKSEESALVLSALREARSQLLQLVTRRWVDRSPQR